MSAEIPGSVQEALASVRRPIEDSPTLPPACYTDPEVFQWEQRAVFQQGWVGVGRADRWPEVGDYSAIDLGGVPVVVVRDDAGALRAYANSCSHRAAQIMVGEGSCARMRCPFHFWTYGLDGRLIGAPSMAKTPDFERTDHGLHEFHAQVRHGFAFVSLEAEPPSIDEWMGDFGELHTPWSLAELKLAHRREFVVDCNWKPFVEVFNEYYHLPYVHPVSLDGNYDDPDDPDVTTGAYASHFGTTQGTGGLLEKDWDKVLPRIPGLSGHPATGTRGCSPTSPSLVALRPSGSTRPIPFRSIECFAPSRWLFHSRPSTRQGSKRRLACITNDLMRRSRKTCQCLNSSTPA